MTFISHRQSDRRGGRGAADGADGGAPQPCLIVNDLKHEPQAGAVVLWIGPGTEGYFSNLKIAGK
jgi:hypothetical protein